MKCIMFKGKWFDAQDQFNEWAKGKLITRDVIIHTVAIQNESIYQDASVVIVVYYAEGGAWDTPREKPKPPIQDIEVTARKAVEEAIPA